MGRRVTPRKHVDGIEWRQDTRGYWYRDVPDVSVRYGFRRIWEHRAVWEKHHGPIPAGHHIHHVNHDRGDNRPENLEPLTPKAHRHVHRDVRTTVTCQGCGSSVECSVEGSPKRWCDTCFRQRDIENHSWRKTQVKQCEYCGGDFTTRLAPNGGRTGRFCSQRCVNLGSRWARTQHHGS